LIADTLVHEWPDENDLVTLLNAEPTSRAVWIETTRRILPLTFDGSLSVPKNA
jgi:hypothetical protein